MRRIPMRAGALAAVLALGLATCGSGDEQAGDDAGDAGGADNADSADAGGQDAGAGGDSGELTPVTAGVIPVTDSGPIALAQEQGIFESHGLELTIETASASPNITSAIMSGDYQIGYGGITSVFQAVEQGIDLVVIAAASATADDPANGINDLLVLPDSGLESAADLEGRQVAVNALGGYPHLLGMIAVAGEGGDPDAVQWVELPVPDQPAALANGTIDSFVAGEPFGTLGRAEGFVAVANPHELLHDGAVVAGAWFASRAAVEEDPEYYGRIVDALEEANQFALDNDDLLREAIADFTGIDQDLAAEIRLGSYGKLPLDVEYIQPLADAALEFGYVQNPVDLEALIWQR
ncbi:ABC transporter substrate-binding protein [Phytoactinopolyspora mesophila]|nr:ABC transporter substrate-binding protein [Phytoactinopolyspora mesophila]